MYFHNKQTNSSHDQIHDHSISDTKDPKSRGQNVALLETPNGVTIIGNKHAANPNEDIYTNGTPTDRLSVQHRTHPDGDEDDSFEYATDRESSVYNPTTVPIRSVMAAAGGRNSQRTGTATAAAENAEPTESADLLTRGNQLGIPESRFSRWIPKDQREILEKQAKLLANRITKTPEMDRSQRMTTTTSPPPPPVPTKPVAVAKPHETEI